MKYIFIAEFSVFIFSYLFTADLFVDIYFQVTIKEIDFSRPIILNKFMRTHCIKLEIKNNPKFANYLCCIGMSTCICYFYLNLSFTR